MIAYTRRQAKLHDWRFSRALEHSLTVTPGALHTLAGEVRAEGASVADAKDGRQGPLQDIRVVEMGQLLAGPFCGQLLADFGAEVIKIEPPGVGDPMREWGREKAHGKSLWWPVVARNKKSITLNLREPAG